MPLKVVDDSKTGFARRKQALETERRYDQEFLDSIESHAIELTRREPSTFQINITKLCNQACEHCHVDSSPKRREMLSESHIARILELLERYPTFRTVDITGGAPELHPGFRDFVIAVRELGREVMVRHNLTVTHDPHPMSGESMEYLPDFFEQQQVHIVSSLPYYQEFLTDKQRGEGVFQKSIKSLQLLNARGFGIADSGRVLDLVYNPVGPYLPAGQVELEQQYKEHLLESFNVQFNSLFVITNMPIHRFRKQLVAGDQYEAYLEKLRSAFNPHAAENVMCRDLISVAHDGRIYDCDFHQVLELSEGEDLTLDNFSLELLRRRPILFRSHCFGCTAGAGSSCGGATV